MAPDALMSGSEDLAVRLLLAAMALRDVLTLPGEWELARALGREVTFCLMGGDKTGVSLLPKVTPFLFKYLLFLSY